MVLNNCFSTSLSRLGVCAIFAAALMAPVSSSAQALSEEAKIMQKNDLIGAFHDSTAQKIQYKELLSQRLKDSVGTLAGTFANVNLSIKQDILARQNAKWSFSNYLKDLLMIKAMDSLSTQAVEQRLNAINYAFYSGYANVPNMDFADGANPITRGTPGAVDRYFYDLYMKNFCVLGSATNTQHCDTNSATGITSFHDFFISDKSWPEAKVLDVMRMASRFFSGMDTRQSHVNDLEDRSNFLEARGKQMRANMRMAVLNNLAARRAPVSRNTSLAVDILINAYARTGQIRSSRMEDMCDQTDLTPPEAHICGMLTAPIDSDGTRLISQAVVDRIMQYDLHMSPLSYDNISSATYVDGALDRYELSLKAQLVSQAYRELELLKMKTALYAMNMLTK